MVTDPIGHALIHKEFRHTTMWPGPQFTLSGEVDMEKEYKEALAGDMVPVLERGVDGSYLVLGESKKTGGFIWCIEEGDVRQFIPIIKKFDTLMPGGLPMLEQLMYVAREANNRMRDFYQDEKERCRTRWQESKTMPRKMKKRQRREILLDWGLACWGEKNLTVDF